MQDNWESIGAAAATIAGCAMIVLIVVGPALVREWRKAHLAKSEAALKQAMVERGMTADEIIRVLQAGHTEEASSASCGRRALVRERADDKS
jgi:hypothetical protein